MAVCIDFDRLNVNHLLTLFLFFEYGIDLRRRKLMAGKALAYALLSRWADSGSYSIARSVFMDLRLTNFHVADAHLALALEVKCLSRWPWLKCVYSF